MTERPGVRESVIRKKTLFARLCRRHCADGSRAAYSSCAIEGKDVCDALGGLEVDEGLHKYHDAPSSEAWNEC